MMNTSVTNPWISIRRPNPNAIIRLFCFPYSGAGASAFNKWQDRLPSSVELCAIQLPGRENRVMDPLFTRMPPLIEEISTAIQPYLDMPFVFFGHSLGALFAFELTRHFQAQTNALPEHLFLSGHVAPQLPNREAPIHHLPDTEFIDAIQRYNGIPDAVLADAELRELVIPVLRADFEVFETYIYEEKPPLDCPMTALGGLQDDWADREGLEPWREHTTSTFQVRMFPGDHFYVNTALPMLLQVLAQALDQTANKISARRYL